MRRLVLLAVCALLLCSCVGIDSALTIRADGSGTLAISYRVARALADLGKTDDALRTVPLPVERRDFEQALASAPGVKLERYSMSVGDQDVTVRASLSFDRISSLARLGPLSASGLAVQESGGHGTFTDTLYRASQPAPDADALTMVDDLFQGYDVALELTAPAPITAHSVGTLSTNGRTLSWRATVPELLRGGKDVVLTASW